MTEIYSGLHMGQQFASLEEFKALVRSISVRQHWELRVTRSNKKSVVIGCRSSNNCFFRVVCRANKNATYISSLQDRHSCRSNAASTTKTPVRSEVSHVRFLLNEIPKLFDMRNNVKAQEVVDAVKRYHGYEISIRQAQRALIRLQQQQTQNQEERADTLDSSGDDQQDSHLPPSEEPAEGSTYSSLSGPRWIPDNMQHGLMDAAEGMQHGGMQRNHPALQAPQIHNEALQSHAQLEASHQVQPTTAVHHPPNIQSPEQATLGNPLNQPITPHQTRYAVSAPHPPSAPQTGQPKPQRQLQTEGHPAAAQLVLTNFKIEFTCTTCGALNQSFFPNQGNITGGSYLPQSPIPGQNAAEGTGRPTQSIQGSSGASRVAEAHGYGGDTAAGHRGVPSPWTPGTLDVPIAPAHT